MSYSCLKIFSSTLRLPGESAGQAWAFALARAGLSLVYVRIPGCSSFCSTPWAFQRFSFASIGSGALSEVADSTAFSGSTT